MPADEHRRQASATPGGAHASAGEREASGPADAGLRRPGGPTGFLWLLLAAVILPTLFLGGRLGADRVMLPHLPAALPPLADEYPGVTWDDVRYGPADRVFPTLSDQVVAREELARRDLPTWAPRLGLGSPLFANSIAGLAYPPNWIALVVGPGRAAAPLAWFSLVLAGLGMGLFLRRVGLGSAAVVIGISALQAGGYGLQNLGYFMKVDAAVWLPWSLWAVEGLARGRRFSLLALSASIGLAFLAGFPQVAVFALFATGVYAAARLSAPGARLLGVPEAERGDAADAFFVRVGGRALLAAMLGIGIGAWQLLPTVQASGGSMRQPKTADDVAREALPFGTTLGLVVPDLIGSPLAPDEENGPAAAWWLTPAEDFEKALHANGLEWNVFAGIAALLLAVAALFGDPRRARAPAIALILCYAFAQGWPIVRLLYHVPGLGAGSPNRVLAVAWILWPWLAALGADALLRSARARIAWIVACAVVGGGAVLATSMLDEEEFARSAQDSIHERYQAMPEPPSREVVASFAPLEDLEQVARRIDRGLRHTGGHALLLLMFALVIHFVRGDRREACVMLIVAALWSEGDRMADRHLPDQPAPENGLFPRSDALARVAEAAGDGRVVRIAPGADTTALVAAVEKLARPNLLQPYGISDLTPWTVFTPGGLVELVGETAHGAGDGLDPEARFRSGIAGLARLDRLGHPLLDLLRVRCVLATDAIESPALELVHGEPGFHVYRRASAMPPARIVGNAIASPSDEVVRGLLVSGAFDAANQALLAPGIEARAPDPDAHTAEIASVSRPARNRLDLHVKASRGGLLVMHEQWAPGWKATINGEDAEILRVDHVYRGLWLPDDGRDLVIRTKYEPWSLRIGFVAMLTSLVIAGFLGWRRGW